jgi:hypothetical protein
MRPGWYRRGLVPGGATPAPAPGQAQLLALGRKIGVGVGGACECQKCGFRSGGGYVAGKAAEN